MYYCLGLVLRLRFFDSSAFLVSSMHGTVEWLPGQPLGNDRTSWSDELVDLPNIYVYAANNPSGEFLLNSHDG
jgi:magnesium chelatase subunit H